MVNKKKVKKSLKKLKIDELTDWLRRKFERFYGKRGKNKNVSLADSLMSGFAMFSLKDSSLLSFDNNRETRKENLKNRHTTGHFVKKEKKYKKWKRLFKFED